MKNFYQSYVDEPKWFKISEERFLEVTEGRGAYKKGTAIKAIEDCGTIRTDFSFFKSEREYLLDIAKQNVRFSRTKWIF